MNVCKSIRARITLWHMLVLVVSLLAYMFLNISLLRRQLTIELQSSLEDDMEIVESYLAAAESRKIIGDSHENIIENDGLKRWIEVREMDGRIVHKNFSGPDLLPPEKMPSLELHKRTFPEARRIGDEKVMAVQEIHAIAGHKLFIMVARSTERLEQELRHLFFAQLLSFPVVLALAWVGGYFVAGRMLSPLKKMVARTTTISAESLDQRLPVDNPDDELGQLSLTFNDLLAKLDRSFKQMRQFTADASHELRTPLAAIRAVGENALRSGSGEERCRETIASILEEVDKMALMVSELLTLARCDGSTSKARFGAADLCEVVADEVALQTVLAEEKELRLSLETPERCPVELDRNLFRQAVSNILHNAIKYSPRGGEIRILTGRTAGSCFVEIRDQGPGIGAEHRDRIFDRFYRVDKVRSRETGGAGLGLAIARRVVEIHAGRLELLDVAGPGCSFRITLPCPHGKGSNALA